LALSGAEKKGILKAIKHGTTYKMTYATKESKAPKQYLTTKEYHSQREIHKYPAYRGIPKQRMQQPPAYRGIQKPIEIYPSTPPETPKTHTPPQQKKLPAGSL
jgi:hypothetical protein